MIAQCRPPLSLPAKSEFLRVIVTGLMALDGVGMQLQTAIFEEQAQSVPVVQRVADRLGQAGGTRDAAELVVSHACMASTSGRLCSCRTR